MLHTNIQHTSALPDSVSTELYLAIDVTDLVLL